MLFMGVSMEAGGSKPSTNQFSSVWYQDEKILSQRRAKQQESPLHFSARGPCTHLPLSRAELQVALMEGWDLSMLGSV